LFSLGIEQRFLETKGFCKHAVIVYARVKRLGKEAGGVGPVMVSNVAKSHTILLAAVADYGGVESLKQGSGGIDCV
jgi:hypothetical protein